MSSGKNTTEGCLFGLGVPNDGFSQFFTGRSYLNPLTNPDETQAVYNIGCSMLRRERKSQVRGCLSFERG